MKTKLHNTRIKKGLSQEQIADMLGMTQSNYSRKEKGSTKISIIEWERIAKKLEVPLEDIFEEDEKKMAYVNNNGNNNFNFGTINFNIPDFVLNIIEILQESNKTLTIENQILKEKISIYAKQDNI